MEANPLTTGLYHIEISGSNGLALLAYKTDVLVVGSYAQWDGLATIGAYNMAFRQECHSLFTPAIQAKQWRGNWVQSTATSPSIQLTEWLRLCLSATSKYRADNIPITQVLSNAGEKETKVVSIHLTDAPIEWNALCDAHIDTMFGSQVFLTDLTNATVTLYFDASSKALVGVVFTAENGQTHINGTIAVSAYDGRELSTIPATDTISEGILHEEWDLYSEE